MRVFLYRSAEIDGDTNGDNDQMADNFRAPARKANDTVEIAFFFDRGVAPLAAVAAHSISVNRDRSRGYVLHVFHQGCSAGDLAPLAAAAAPGFDIRISELAPAGPGFPPGIHFQVLRLGSLLPAAHRVVYLDVDLVVLDDIGKLFDHPLDGAPLAAAVDRHIVYRRRRGSVLSLGRYEGSLDQHMTDVLRIEPAMHDAFFNSGVLLIDLDAFRRLGVEAAAPGIVAEDDGRMWCRDQHVLNRLFATRAKRLDGRWNVIVPKSRRQERSYAAFGHPTPAEPAVIHFAGNKPWSHHVRPYATIWWRYAFASPAARTIVRAFLAHPGPSRLQKAYSLLDWALRHAPALLGLLRGRPARAAAPAE